MIATMKANAVPSGSNRLATFLLKTVCASARLLAVSIREIPIFWMLEMSHHDRLMDINTKMVASTIADPAIANIKTARSCFSSCNMRSLLKL
jgi:hypothetical protein